MHLPKKFYILLVIIVILAGLLVFKESRRALGITITPKEEPLISTVMAGIPESPADPIFGNPGAPVTVIEFADLSSQKSQSIHSTITSFVYAHPLKIRLIWKNAPATKWLGSDSILAHQTAYCIAKQNPSKFWNFTNIVWQNKRNLREAELKKIIENLGINYNTLWPCATSKEAMDNIGQAMTDAKTNNISAPAIFINNRKINLDENINITDLLNKFIEPETTETATTPAIQIESGGI